MNARYHSPDLRQLPFLGQPSREVVAHDLTMLRARPYAPKTIQATIGMLKAFCVRLPPAHQPRIAWDITQTTADDLDTWLDVAHHHGLAPSTINNILNALHRFFAFRQEQGQLTRQPSHRRRPQVFVPQTLPQPMAEADLIHVFQVMDALHDRTMFLLMLRCGLRVSEVGQLKVSDIDWTQQARRIAQGQGRQDRRVYLSAEAVASVRECVQRRPSGVPGDAVFWNQTRPSRPLSAKAIQQKMAR